MDIYLEGKKKITLTRADFKAQGGEGSVYVKGKTAFKVYADPAKMISPGKIAELTALTQPEIIRPQQILTDAAQTPIGYTMDCVPKGIPLCQTFAKAFRDRERLTPDRMLRLVRALQAGVAHVHAQGLLIVDLNETNFLADDRFEHVYFIDVDSYQTPSYPATALMDTVRDRHASTFSPETDWFAFAIVSFQMFIGIHPYKGKHPTLKTLDERMQANVSACRPEIALPAACLPFDVIPDIYRQWYRAVLDQGVRCPPPDRLDAAVLILPPIIKRHAGSQCYDVEELQEFDAEVLRFAHGLVVTSDGVIVGGRPLLTSQVQIGIVPQTGHAVAAWIDRGCLRFYDLHQGGPLIADIAADEVMATEGRLYAKNGPSLLEIEFSALPARTLVHAKLMANVLEQATQVFEGVALQNMLGAWYATLLPARGQAYQVRLPEIDGCHVIDAKFQNRVLILAVAQGGQYDTLILRFDKHFQTYDVRRRADVPTPEINFVVLDSGVCLHLNANDELEVFSHRLGDQTLKILSDAALGGDCRLFKNGTQALFARGRTLYKFGMRK
jgi:hypothetical protein